MDFDINETLAHMLGALKKNVAEYWTETKGTANQFMQNRKARLELLAKFRIENKITDDDLKSYLEDEKKLLEAELHAIAVITKAMAERAANAALDILFTAIKTAVKLV